MTEREQIILASRRSFDGEPQDGELYGSLAILQTLRLSRPRSLGESASCPLVESHNTPQGDFSMKLPRRPRFWYLAAAAVGFAAFIILVIGRDLTADELARQHVRERANELHSEIADHLAAADPGLADMSADALGKFLDGATTWKFAEPRRLDDDSYEFTVTATVELSEMDISATLPFIFNVSESAQRVISQSNFENAEVSHDSSP